MSPDGGRRHGDGSPVKRVINPYADTDAGPAKKYDRSSSFYHFIMGIWEIKPSREALEMAGLQPGERVLDVAFGTGWCLERIIRQVETTVYGVDYSAGMCTVCRGNLARAELEHRAVLVRGDATALPFADGCFDVAFSTFLLDLLPADGIPAALSEMRRMLTPGGRLVAMTMTKQGDGLLHASRRLYEWFYDIWPVIGGYRASSRPIHLEREVRRAGFTINASRLTHIPLFHFPVAIVVARPTSL